MVTELLYNMNVYIYIYIYIVIYRGETAIVDSIDLLNEVVIDKLVQSLQLFLRHSLFFFLVDYAAENLLAEVLVHQSLHRFTYYHLDIT